MIEKCFLFILLAFSFFHEKEKEIPFNVKPTEYSNGVCRWDISLDKEKTDIKQIDKIVYNLDGFFFKNPVRQSKDTSSGFLVTVFSNKESEAEAEVHFKNGSVTRTIIQLNKPHNESSLRLKNTAVQVGKGSWSWEIFISGKSDEINQIDYVGYKLHSSFKDPYQEVKEKGDSKRPFALKGSGWGFFLVKATVFLKNKNSFSLQHVLQFDTILVDVFYLQSKAEVTKSKADSIANLINKDDRFKAFVRPLSDEKNKMEGYGLVNNEIRYETLEEEYMDDITHMMEKGNIATTFEKNLITYETPEYISIFVVK